MKKLFTAIMMCFVAIGMNAQFTSAPAFPGAEGFGRYVTGGRGGKIVHVTNLNDSGTGSFRAAVNGDAKKIVVFDVGGVIALNSDLVIGANTTILGQTAPSPGITVRYRTVRPKGNSIIRFMRFRRGQEKDVDDGADAMWQRNITGLIIDHCSFSWSIDEVASFYDNNNFTMQWCTLGESLNNAGHGKGAHGYGGIWGGKLASFHHNLICHVNNRSPRFCGARYDWTGYTDNALYDEYKWENAVQAENVDLRNCVVYNCGNGCYGGPGGGQINMVNNYFKTGPAATTNRFTTVSYGDSGNSSGYPKYWTMTSRYYINGNVMYNNSSATNNNWNAINYDSSVPTLNGVRYTYDENHYYGSDKTYTQVNSKDALPIKLEAPIATGSVTTHTAATAFDKVLTYAGASLMQDDVDKRYFTEARNGTATYTGSVTGKKGRIDLVSDVNGYTEATFGTGSRVSDFDADNDGIADAWETANGLNPADASDALTYTLDPKGYYTNLEVYANNLVETIMKEGRADADDTFDEYYPTATYVDVNPDDGGEGGGDTGVTTGTESTIRSTDTVKDTDFSGLSYTIAGASIAGYGNSNMALKVRTSRSTVITVNENYTIIGITVTGANNYDTADVTIDGVYVDGSSENLLSEPVVFSKDKSTNSFSLSDFAATQNITITYTSGGSSQVNLTFTFTYQYKMQKLAYVGKTATNGRSGTVTLIFNNPMTDTNSPTATLGGQTLNGVAEGTTVKFAYSGLDYGQTYTFTVPANTLQDEAGNKYASEISFDITTATRSAVTKKKFDFVVGKDGDADAAFTAANAYSGSGRYLIFVPDGTYTLKGNQTITLGSDKDALTGTDGSTVEPGSTFTNAMTWLKKSNVSVIGQSEEKTILTNTPLYPGISYTSTLEIRNGYSNNYLQDLTLKNNYANGAHDKGVAVAFYDRGTNTILKNVKCWSNQDTYTSQATRCYYENATFAGTVDFICGSGDVWFEACDLIINDRAGNVIAAPRTDASEKWGYVFNGCTISLAEGATAAKDGNWNLGRPWNYSPAATYLYTKMNTTPSSAGWTKMTDGCVLRFHEYGSMDSSGSTISLTGRSTSACNGADGSDNPVLTAEQAVSYTIANAVGNDGAWDPASLTEKESVENLQASIGTLTWDANDYALCWVVFKDGVYLDNVTTNSISITDDATYSVRAANEMGGLGEPATIVYSATGINAIENGQIKDNAPLYNAAGQRVNGSFRGVVIQNGKKVMKR